MGTLDRCISGSRTCPRLFLQWTEIGHRKQEFLFYHNVVFGRVRNFLREVTVLDRSSMHLNTLYPRKRLELEKQNAYLMTMAAVASPVMMYLHFPLTPPSGLFQVWIVPFPLSRFSQAENNLSPCFPYQLTDWIIDLEAFSRGLRVRSELKNSSPLWNKETWRRFMWVTAIPIKITVSVNLNLSFVSIHL